MPYGEKRIQKKKRGQSICQKVGSNQSFTSQKKKKKKEMWKVNRVKQM